MKFRFFLAVTMLIVLISQHSTNGIPVNKTQLNNRCLEGLELINGECVPKDLTTSEKMITHEEELTTQVNLPKTSGNCPEGMRYVEGGHCEEIQTSNTTEINIQLTTDSNENRGGVENPKGCPQGTEADEQGACQEIKPTNSTKIIINPKDLLKKDGSCPDNYKMIQGRCLYIKSQMNFTRLHAKDGHVQSLTVESVPVLPDNSCPIGTEYSEYGLCQKRLQPSRSALHTKSDNTCADDFELINGKCVYKNLKVNVSSESPVRTTSSPNVISNNEEFSTTSTPL